LLRFIDFSYAHFFPVPRVFCNGCQRTWNPPGRVRALLRARRESVHICSTRLRGFRFLLDRCAVITLDSSLQFRISATKARRRNHVLGSSVCVRETNSPRAGYYLRRTCESSSAPRRSAQCWPRDGRKSFRQRRSLASSSRLRRKTADSRTLCQPAAQTPRVRRCRSTRISRKYEKTRLVAGKKNVTQIATDKIQAAELDFLSQAVAFVDSNLAAAFR